LIKIYIAVCSKNCSTYLNSNKCTVIITIVNEERSRLTVHLTKIPQKYTCPLRRQLSTLCPRRPMPNHVPTRVRRGSSYHSGTVDCQWADAWGTNTAGGSSSDTCHTEST